MGAGRPATGVAVTGARCRQSVTLARCVKCARVRCVKIRRTAVQQPGRPIPAQGFATLASSSDPAGLLPDAVAAIVDHNRQLAIVSRPPSISDVPHWLLTFGVGGDTLTNHRSPNSSWLADAPGNLSLGIWKQTDIICAVQIEGALKTGIAGEKIVPANAKDLHVSASAYVVGTEAGLVVWLTSSYPAG